MERERAHTKGYTCARVKGQTFKREREQVIEGTAAFPKLVGREKGNEEWGGSTGVYNAGSS